jgi:hypothetical protein
LLPAPSVAGRRRRRRCPCFRRWVIHNPDFADIELADDAGDVAAAAVARDLARGAAITAGGGGGGVGGGGGGSDGASLVDFTRAKFV